MALIQNALRIVETDLYLVSTDVHAYVEYAFRDGRIIAIDGGKEYARRAGDCLNADANFLDGRYEEWCLNDTDPIEWIRNRLLWGTRGKDGTLPYQHRTVRELAARPDGMAHMRAILRGCLNINPIHKSVVEYWLAMHELAQEVIEG